ncbi:MAG: nuclear transport factor 2 family protein [Anaerolineae bacterium]
MKRDVMAVGRVVGLVVFLAGVVVLVGCQAKPDEVAMKLAEAVNAQDLDKASALFAEDAVVNSASPEPFTGKEEIRGWLEGMFADNFELEIEILEVSEDKVVERDRMTMDSVSALGVRSLEGTSEITVQDGKITELTFTFSEESLAELQVATANAIEPTHADINFREDGDPAHTLDVYLPEAMEGPLPVLFALHGGEGSKKDLHGLAGYFVQNGYAAVLPQLPAKNEPDRALQLEDSFCSLAWLHANADAYGLDPQRVVVFGYSMGGHQGANLGTIDDPSHFLEGCPHSLPESGWLRGVATYAGVFSTPEACLSAGWCQFGAAAGCGMTLDEIDVIFGELSNVPPSEWLDSSELSEQTKLLARSLPLAWLDGSEPPFRIMHGAADEMVPPGESEAFASRLQAAGVDAELMLFPGMGHNPPFMDMCEAVGEFASAVLAE